MPQNVPIVEYVQINVRGRLLLREQFRFPKILKKIEDKKKAVAVQSAAAAFLVQCLWGMELLAVTARRDSNLFTEDSGKIIDIFYTTGFGNILNG